MNKKDLVVKENSLINSKGKYKYKKNELKLICVLISNIQNKYESDFERKYFDLKELGFSEKEFNNYTYVKKLCEDLMSKPFWLNGSLYNWFTKLTPVDGAGKIEYQFHDDLKPYLLDVKKNFTSYAIENILKLKSSYSIHIFELLMQLKNKGHRTIFLEDFKEILKIPKSYRNIDVKRLLDKSKEDIYNNTQIEFEYKLTKNGRAYNKIEFFIKNNTKSRQVLNHHFNALIKRKKDLNK